MGRRQALDDDGLSGDGGGDVGPTKAKGIQERGGGLTHLFLGHAVPRREGGLTGGQQAPATAALAQSHSFNGMRPKIESDDGWPEGGDKSHYALGTGKADAKCSDEPLSQRARPCPVIRNPGDLPILVRDLHFRKWDKIGLGVPCFVGIQGRID